MSEPAVVRFPVAVPERSQQTELPPKWKAIRVSGKDYRVVPGDVPAGEELPRAFTWYVLRGENAFGEPDWRETQAPGLIEVIAALYAAS